MSKTRDNTNQYQPKSTIRIALSCFIPAILLFFITISFKGFLNDENNILSPVFSLISSLLNEIEVLYVKINLWMFNVFPIIDWAYWIPCACIFFCLFGKCIQMKMKVNSILDDNIKEKGGDLDAPLPDLKQMKSDDNDLLSMSLIFIFIIAPLMSAIFFYWISALNNDIIDDLLYDFSMADKDELIIIFNDLSRAMQYYIQSTGIIDIPRKEAKEILISIEKSNPILGVFALNIVLLLFYLRHISRTLNDIMSNKDLIKKEDKVNKE